MEEDAGKSIHDAGDRDGTRVDLNRAGVPLIEIVSEPDMRSRRGGRRVPARAARRSCATSTSPTPTWRRVSFRCDANVSRAAARRDALGTRTELKNLNSFRSVEGAIDAEIARQIGSSLEGGGRSQQATRLRRRSASASRVDALKENADDYRYFPDPDLLAARARRGADRRDPRARCPSCPRRAARASQREYGLPPTTRGVLTGEPRARRLLRGRGARARRPEDDRELAPARRPAARSASAAPRSTPPRSRRTRSRRSCGSPTKAR